MPAPKDIVDSVSEFARQVYTGTVPPLSPKAKWGIVGVVVLTPFILFQCEKMNQDAQHRQRMRQWCNSIELRLRDRFPECNDYIPGFTR